MRRLVLATVMATLVLAGEARADSVTLNAFTTAGQPDMVAGVARVWSVSGVATNPTRLYAKRRPVGGQPCAPSASTDTGTNYFDEYITVNGVFDHREAYSWSSPGTYQFCYWFASSRDAIVSPITQTVTIRQPTGSITATIDPFAPRPGQPATVTVTGTTESPKEVYAKVRPAGSACAPSYDSDTGSSIIYSADVEGQFTVTATTTQSTAGNYVACLWLASGSGDSAPIAGPQPQPFSVVQPPPALSSAQVINCTTGRRVSSFRARKVGSVCMRYQFSTAPLAGARVTVSFVRPNRRTHTVARTTWGESQSQPITLGPLNARAWRNRRGTWKAVLRVDGRTLHAASFRVRR